MYQINVARVEKSGLRWNLAYNFVASCRTFCSGLSFFMPPSETHCFVPGRNQVDGGRPWQRKHYGIRVAAAVNNDQTTPNSPNCTQAAVLLGDGLGMELRIMSLASSFLYRTVHGVHPGWVQTDMGGPKADFTVEVTTEQTLAEICCEICFLLRLWLSPIVVGSLLPSTGRFTVAIHRQRSRTWRA